MDQLMTDFVHAQTSVPDWLMTYCRQLADVHYGRRLNRMYLHMLQSFLAYEPWKATPPFAWRTARSARSFGGTGHKDSGIGWVPMNMTLPIALYDKAKIAIEMINMNNGELTRDVSLRTFLYTMVIWWCSDVFPYNGPGMIPS